MLAPLVNAVDKTNSTNATLQLIVLVMFGAFTYFNFGPAYISHKPVMSVSPEVEEQKILYKMVKGVAEYCRNSTRIQKNVQLRDMIVEVGLTYGLESNSKLQPLMDRAISDAGLKDDIGLNENKDKVVKVFDDLALEIKTNIEKIQSK